MNDTSRKQGWAITGTAVVLGLLFLNGILNGSYVALAIPVAVLTLFVLGLVAWVGHTIATVQVEAEAPAAEPAANPPSDPNPPSPPGPDSAGPPASRPEAPPE